MSKSLDRRNARKLANPAYLEKMCNVLSSENKNYVVCALALMNCMLQACSKGRAKRRLKLATKYIRVRFQMKFHFLNLSYFRSAINVNSIVVVTVKS